MNNFLNAVIGLSCAAVMLAFTVGLGGAVIVASIQQLIGA